MMCTKRIKSLFLSAGAALALSVMQGSAVADQANPFGLSDAIQTYSVAAAEGKCGDSNKKSTEAKCGEGKCGDGKQKAKAAKCGEGKCGDGKSKPKEAKCGDGK